MSAPASGKRPAEGSVERDDVEDAAAATTAKRTDHFLADIVPDLNEILKSNEGSYLIKILVPLGCCARMIGPKGACMNGMMQTTGCKIRLSSIEALYPNTQDRVLSIAGSPEKLAQAIFEVLTNLLQETDTGSSSSSSSTNASPYLSSLLSSAPAASASQQKFKYIVRALFPASAAGSVIGRGGTVIQRLSEESGCRIKFEGVDQSCLSSTKERIMFVHGDEVGAMVSAVQLSLAQMLTSPTVCVYENQGVNYVPLQSFRGAGPMGMIGGGGGGWAGMNDPMGMARGGSGAMGGANARDNGGGQAYLTAAYPAQQTHVAMAGNPYAMQLPPAFTTEPAMMEMGIDDDKIGCVLGAQGRAIKEIMTLSGTQITVSQRTDYFPGTKNRRLTIVGPPANIQMACSMVQHRLSIAVVGNQAKPNGE